MPVNTKAIGKSYDPVIYAVGREKVLVSTRARSARPTRCTSTSEAARAAGAYADVVAAADVRGRLQRFLRRSARRSSTPRSCPELNFAMMVHGGQEFEWGPLVVAGDEISTATTVKDISERDGRAYYVFESISTNQRGEQVCRVESWTNIVRGV